MLRCRNPCLCFAATPRQDAQHSVTRCRGTVGKPRAVVQAFCLLMNFRQQSPDFARPARGRGHLANNRKTTWLTSGVEGVDCSMIGSADRTITDAAHSMPETSNPSLAFGLHRGRRGCDRSSIILIDAVPIDQIGRELDCRQSMQGNVGG